MEEATKGEVVIADIGPDILEKIVEFIYAGTMQHCPAFCWSASPAPSPGYRL